MGRGVWERDEHNQHRRHELLCKNASIYACVHMDKSAYIHTASKGREVAGWGGEGVMEEECGREVSVTRAET